MKLYIDGADVTGAVTNQTLSNSTSQLAIGHHPLGSGDALDAYVDEAAVYGVALSASQVQQHYGAGNGCSNIAGATSQSYTVASADIGMRLRVIVNASNADGSGSAGSAQTAAVAAGAPSNTALPTISGTPQQAQTLTATSGTWSGTQPISYAYQWRRCDSGGASCSDIPGATSANYTAVAADVGSTLRVQVTASNAVGSSSASSAQTATVAPIPVAPSNTSPPTISGTAQEGQSLTADPGTWSGTQPISFVYQWRRCDAGGASCNDINGATGQSYTLVSADVGATLRVSVTASNTVGSSTASSAPTALVAAAAPANTSPPTISGTPQQGQSLTADPGTWSGTPPISYAYQWRRCDPSGLVCGDISGATSQSYTLVAADVGDTIRVVVTASNNGGSSSATSAQTGAVAGNGPANTSPPTISGTAQQGQTLSADPGSWSGTQPISYAYQWRRCDSGGAACADIGGATSQTYTLVAADVGATIRVVVTASNSAGSNSASSAQTAPVVGIPPSNTAAPTISGTTRDGQNLTADPGSWSGTAPITYSYQWRRCDTGGASCVDTPAAATSQAPPSRTTPSSRLTWARRSGSSLRRRTRADRAARRPRRRRSLPRRPRRTHRRQRSPEVHSTERR